MKQKWIYCLVLVLFKISVAEGQAKTEKEMVADSIYFSQPYPYILPIMGSKAHEAKNRMPLPFGIMFNVLAGKQYFQLNDMAVGFGNYSSATSTNMIDISDIVVFDRTELQTSTYNLRIDSWILPFLDVYGIVGQTKKANINIKLKQPFPLDVTTEVLGTYVGYGAMLAGKVGPIFISLDANQTFTYNPRLDEPAIVSLSGFRAGPVFKIKDHPEMNVTLWLGAMYSYFHGETEGSIDALELAPDASAKIEEMHESLDSWYEGLNKIQQGLYAGVYNKLGNGLDKLSNNVDDGYINYYFDKSIKNPWNMLVGGQWQINDRWQFRAETQFFGDRTAGLFSLNYRFGIRGKNWFSK